MKKIFIYFLVAFLILISQFTQSKASTITTYPTVSQFSVGTDFMGIVNENGKIYTWGRNADGQLGLGNYTDKISPTQVVVAGITFTTIALGNAHALAVDTNKDVWAWGRNNFGQTGNAITSPTLNIPTQVNTATGTLGNVVKVAAGDGFSVALDATGVVYTWGNNMQSQLGDGTVITNPKATALATLTDVIDIQCGQSYTLALKSDGTVWMWGDNTYGQSGTSPGTSAVVAPKKAPTKITAFSNVFISKIFAGATHALAIDDRGNVWAWGDNRMKEINSSTSSTLTPLMLTAVTDVDKIAAGSEFTIFQKIDGTLWSVGKNIDGELGIATNVNQYVLSQVSSIINVKDIYAGYNSVIAMKTDGSIYTFGDNKYGKLGISNLAPANSAVPVVIRNFWWPSFYYSVDSANAIASAVFDVNVNCKFSRRISGFQFVFSYDPAIATITNNDISKGNALLVNGLADARWVLDNTTCNVDAVAKTITVVGYFNDTATNTYAINAPPTEDVLFTMQFTAEAVAVNSVFSLNATTAQVSYPDGSICPISSNSIGSGTISVTLFAKGDIDKSGGAIGVLDLGKMIQILNGTYAPAADEIFLADVDGSGGAAPVLTDVTVLDLVALIRIILGG